MKTESLNAFRKIIREEVKQAIQQEVRDIIIEAVKIASEGTSVPSIPIEPKKEERPIQFSDLKRDTELSELRNKFKAMNPIEQMLEETKLSFTSSDAKNFSGANMLAGNKAGAMAHNLGMLDSSTSNVGLDLSSLPFLKNAKNILDLSKEKDKARYGGN
jgi:hypothetical protein